MAGQTERGRREMRAAPPARSHGAISATRHARRNTGGACRCRPQARRELHVSCAGDLTETVAVMINAIDRRCVTVMM